MSSLWRDGHEAVASDPWPAPPEVDTIVVGAGIVGMATALMLADTGRSVAVLEARDLGAGTTGSSTAKVSLLQGTQLSSLLSVHSQKVGRAYVASNRQAQQWLVAYCAEHGVDLPRADAYTFAATAEERAAARAELDAAASLGLDVEWADDIDLPFETFGAVRLRDQLQVDPMALLRAMAADLRERGGLLLQHVRVTGVDAGRERSRVSTTRGELATHSVVLATGTPILDRGLYWAKLTPHRSYALALETPTAPPPGMYLSAGESARSVRSALGPEGAPLLLTGGNGHVVGRGRPPALRLDELRAWTLERFPGARETHWWAAQDYRTLDHVPFVGRLARSHGSVHLATGFNKWGMTNGVAAALRIRGEAVDDRPEWADVLGRRITHPRLVAQGVALNAVTGLEAARGWAGVAGRLVRTAARAQSCPVGPVCTHLGGALRWNELERSWDCPLHGSRFDAGGGVIEGPATQPLHRHE